ncbi:DUF1778 domain-containing protein [Thiococcus pfennigii]|uniref:type II toxin-antitoxin system TacA family antitoxin n=1 Tax=Thiococcus pfennigii TaxID=1057 RepID=UPI001F5BCE9C|nr:DUF1778 domain-containing protein [Thiococcus pfennigii]
MAVEQFNGALGSVHRAGIARPLVLYSRVAHNHLIFTDAGLPVSQAATKDSRLDIRCDEQTRKLLDRAASYARVSLSEFVLSRAVAAAEQVVQEQESINLRADDFQAFLAALDEPREPSPALQRAFERHTRLVDAE